jgi:TonB family protein
VAGKDKTQAKPERLSTAKPVITEKKDTIPHYVVGAMVAHPMPTYPGGEIALLRFLKDNIIYPPDLDKDGTVYVQYKIDSLGNVVEPKILRGLSPSADSEVLRVVKLLKYKPYKPWGDSGTWNLPVKFIVPEKKDEK